MNFASSAFSPFLKVKNMLTSLKIQYTPRKQTFFMQNLYLAVGGGGVKINFKLFKFAIFSLLCFGSQLPLDVRYPQLGSVPAAGGFGVLGIFLFAWGFFPPSNFFLLCFLLSCTQGRQLPAKVEIAPVSCWKTRWLMVGMSFFRCLSSLDEEALPWSIRLKVRLLHLHFQDLSPGLGCDTHPLWVFLSLVQIRMFLMFKSMSLL